MGASSQASMDDRPSSFLFAGTRFDRKRFAADFARFKVPSRSLFTSHILHWVMFFFLC